MRSWVRAGLKSGLSSMCGTHLFVVGLVCAFGPHSITRAELPVVSLRGLCAEVSEDSPATDAFVVSRTGSVAQKLTVYYHVSGSAKNGRDYVRLPGQVTIPAGASSAIIQIEPIDNYVVEGPQSVILTLTSNVQPFSLVVLPDTQYYSASMVGGVPAMFDRQTQWIVEHKDESNIAFVLHEGDVTDHDVFPEWQAAKKSLRLLDGVVPYALAVGNHDMMTGNSQNPALLFNQFCSLTNYQGLPTFGGVFESDRMNNSFHVFSAGGLDWLVLSIEFGPRNEVLAWANNVVTNHPNHRVILLTHAYLYSDNLLSGSLPSHQWVPSWYGRQNNGVEIWDKLVRHHPNFAFVFCGHICDAGVGRLVSTGDWGNNVYQMLADYQAYPYGGGGFMRIVRIDPSQDKFSVETYSPYLRMNKTEPENQFEYSNVGLGGSVQLTYLVDTQQDTSGVILQDTDVDLSPPSVLSVNSYGQPYQITIRFDEPVEKNSAEDPSHYALSGGITLSNAVLQPDLSTVVLTTATPMVANTDYTLTLTGISDCAFQPNILRSTVQTNFQLASLLAADDFQSEELRFWRVVDQGTMDGPSLWRLASGHLAQFSSIRGPATNSVHDRLGTFVYWDCPQACQWSNYAFSAVLNSRVDGIGVMFRYQNPSNYYKVELDANFYYRFLSRVVNGQETWLASQRGGYTYGRDMQLRVEADGPRFSITLNGAPLFIGPIADQSLSTGSVGLYTWGNTFATFDDVQVSRIEHPPSVWITSPANGTVSSNQSDITVSMQANDPDGDLQRVDLFAGETLLVSSRSTPFTFIWSNAPPDLYTFTAQACDLWGNTTSAPVSISTFRTGIPPSILASPQDQAAIPGDDVMFSVVAGGSGPFRYQWYRGSKALPGGTNAILNLTNVQRFQESDYVVAVRNPSGIIFSQPAYLAVFDNRYGTIQASRSGWVRLHFDKLPAPVSVLQVSSNLIDWTFLSYMYSTNAVQSYLDLSATNRPRRFYRITPYSN